MNAAQAAAFGKAVGAGSRQKILRYCCCNKRSVSDIAEHIAVRQPTATHHLSVLLEAGLVCRVRMGKQVFYTVDQRAVVNCCGNLLLALAPDQEASRLVSECCKE